MGLTALAPAPHLQILCSEATVRSAQESYRWFIPTAGFSQLRPEFSSARRFDSFDEFEEIELHSTVLINRKGQIHWSRRGGEPFMDFDFLAREVKTIESSDR